jgi:hypothetical protein
MASKKLSPQDADAGRARSARTGGRRPNTQRQTEKSMTLYTMSGKRTTIEERDSTTEEERMAEVRARLFTLFDDDAEKEREYAEQNGLKNRATGTFQKIKSIIGESDDEYAGGAAAREPAAGPPDDRAGGGAGAERRKPIIPEQRRQRGEEPAREQAGKKRIEQERRVKPVNPVRAMGAEKLERRGLPDPADGDRARRPSDHSEGAGRPRRPAERTAPARTKPDAAAARVRPDDGRAERPAAPRRSYDQAEPPRNKDVQPDKPDESFRLGDLFKDKEPDMFSRWDQEDETEKRMRERRERRRAEAARRGRGEDDDSRMKTAAALFIAREGMKNFFGKFSGATFRDQEQDEEERAAEEALRELAAARIEDGASSPGGSEQAARAGAAADDEGRRGVPKTGHGADDEGRRGVPKTGHSAGRDTKAGERPAAREKAKPRDESEKRKRSVAASKEEAAPGEKRFKDIEQSVTPKRSRKRAAPAQADSSAADTNAEAMVTGAARPDGDSPEHTGDDARMVPSLTDYFTGGARLSRGAIAWMAGGAAGAVAVVIIATMIVDSHVIGI